MGSRVIWNHSSFIVGLDRANSWLQTFKHKMLHVSRSTEWASKTEKPNEMISWGLSQQVMQILFVQFSLKTCCLSALHLRIFWLSLHRYAMLSWIFKYSVWNPGVDLTGWDVQRKWTCCYQPYQALQSTTCRYLIQRCELGHFSQRDQTHWNQMESPLQRVYLTRMWIIVNTDVSPTTEYPPQLKR